MPSGSYFTLVALVVTNFVLSGDIAHAQVRDRAVVSLNFDDAPAAVTTATDSGKAGKVADAVSFAASPTRIPSAFVTGSVGYSLLIDGTKQQVLSIANSEDTSRPNAVTVSGLFASLHALNDGGTLGLFAKRKVGAGDPTNYGINFQPAVDNFQVYVNDATGFKVVNYSVKGAIGYRRRVHLTVSLDQGDAPGADADADADDVRIRLFINGVPLAPVKASGGFAEGNVGWLQDVMLAKCVNDTPLLIGSSFANGEMMKLICDEVHVFAEALTDEDAKALFVEVAGPAAAEITADQGSAGDGAKPLPQIVRVAPHSAEIGKTTRMVLAGQNLESAKLHTDIKGLTVAVAEGGNAGQAVIDVTADATVVPGRYLVRCVTPAGVSNPVIITLDRIATHPEGTFTEANPAATFPIASSGLISGAEQKRVWFKGTANQKIVAEVESRRVGSKLDPVIEIRSQAGTPLAIQWQQSDLKGDARTAVVLPADGLYFAEVHDLQFRAPGGSPWRLLLGDLPPSSLAFPATVAAATTSLRTVGADAVSEAVSVKTAAGQVAVDAGSPILALPPLKTEAGTLILEPVDGTYAATAIDSAFTAAPFPALLVSGRITAAKEIDTLLLTVTPGQTLHFAVAARELSSPLRPHLAVLNGDAVVAQNDGETGAADPALNFKVPDGVTQLKVQIKDVNGKGSPNSTYRLLVSRTDRQAFQISTRDGALRLPLNGSVPLRLSVVRQSRSFRYTGPIRLAVKGIAGVSIVPESIAASEQNQQVLVMVTRSTSGDANALAAGQSFLVEARAEGAEPVFTTAATVEVDNLQTESLTLPETSLVAGPADSVPATMLLDQVPPVLFRGIPATISVRIIPLTEQVPAYSRFEMTTTEVARREDPNNPNSPLKPQVSLDDFQFGPTSQGVFPLTVRVPADTPSNTIDTVISADFVPQPLAAASGSRSWTAPLVLAINDAVLVNAPAEPAKGKKATMVNIAGSIRRHPFFSEAVTVVLDGLPQGYAATPVAVAADQPAFTVAVTVPESAAPGEVPNLSVRVQHSNGATISKPVAVKLVVE